MLTILKVLVGIAVVRLIQHMSYECHSDPLKAFVDVVRLFITLGMLVAFLELIEHTICLMIKMSLFFVAIVCFLDFRRRTHDLIRRRLC